MKLEVHPPASDLDEVQTERVTRNLCDTLELLSFVVPTTYVND